MMRRLMKNINYINIKKIMFAAAVAQYEIQSSGEKVIKKKNQPVYYIL